jgi:hypothetical protein
LSVDVFEVPRDGGTGRLVAVFVREKRDLGHARRAARSRRGYVDAAICLLRWQRRGRIRRIAPT